MIVGCEWKVEAWIKGENDRNGGQRERERERERDREREKERERERERERNVARLGDDCRHQKRLLVNNSAVSSGVVVKRQECWVL